MKLKLNLKNNTLLIMFISCISFLLYLYFYENYSLLFLISTISLFIKKYIKDKNITRTFLVMSIFLGLAYVYFQCVQYLLFILGCIVKFIHFIMSLLCMQL